ncbi:MAG: alpha-hydroxy-acid oxidizing enzyme [Clostridiales bacterium]|nr:alpha-hydroxy-acid oxidizing enzyme [Clostridiales bacterium]
MDRMTSSDAITRDYLDRWLFEVRHIDSVLADTSFSLWGKTFAAPVCTGALSHLSRFCRLPEGQDGMVMMAEGARDANMICFSGMGPEDETARMISTGASVIKIIKTYRDREMLRSRIRNAEKCGALAVGIDIDHAFNRERGYDLVDGYEIAPITAEEIAGLAASTSLPFVVKGVLSVQDAVKCVNAGVKGIVISHHNGRLNCSVPPLMMLPEIRAAIGKDMVIFTDCSLQNGQDIYRCIAMGADACCIGRPVMEPLKQKGAAGVKETLEDVARDLRYTMSMTGADRLSHITKDVLHFRNW